MSTKQKISRRCWKNAYPYNAAMSNLLEDSPLARAAKAPNAGITYLENPTFKDIQTKLNFSPKFMKMRSSHKNYDMLLKAIQMLGFTVIIEHLDPTPCIRRTSAHQTVSAPSQQSISNYITTYYVRFHITRTWPTYLTSLDDATIQKQLLSAYTRNIDTSESIYGFDLSKLEQLSKNILHDFASTKDKITFCWRETKTVQIDAYNSIYSTDTHTFTVPNFTTLEELEFHLTTNSYPHIPYDQIDLRQQ